MKINARINELFMRDSQKGIPGRIEHLIEIGFPVGELAQALDVTERGLLKIRKKESIPEPLFEKKLTFIEKKIAKAQAKFEKKSADRDLIKASNSKTKDENEKPSPNVYLAEETKRKEMTKLCLSVLEDVIPNIDPIGQKLIMQFTHDVANKKNKTIWPYVRNLLGLK